MESLPQFVDRLSKAIGCYSHPGRGSYSLKKYDTMKPHHMGVFGWVHEKKTEDRFLIWADDELTDLQGHTDADEVKTGAIYTKTSIGVGYYVDKDSTGRDFHKAVRALKVIMMRK